MSFADSLNKTKASQVATMSVNDIAMASEPAVMALSDEPIAAYDGEFERVENSFYLWIDDYNDDKYSIVDNLKNVTINQEQINLTQEENSQVIPFELDRYYDGIDLSQMTFQIYFINALGYEGLATPINVVRSSDKIRFYWLCDASVTSQEGNIQFELRAEGNVSYTHNGKSYVKKYHWKTKPNGEINILKSLAGNGAIEPSVGWDTYLQQISSLVAEASDSATAARQAVADIERIATEVDEKIDSASTEIANDTYTKVMEQISEELSKYCTDEEAADLIAGIQNQIDELDGLANFNVEYDGTTMTFYNGETIMKEIQINSDPTAEWEANYDTKVDTKISEAVDSIHSDLQTNYYNKSQTETFVQEEIAKVDVSDQLADYMKIEDTYNAEQIDEKLANVKVDLTGYATEKFVTDKTDVLETDVATNKADIQTANTAIATINETLASIDKSPNAQYTTTYNEPYEVDGVQYTGENTLAVYEIYYKDTEQETRTVVSAHVITGGSGGSSSSNVIKIERITASPLVVTQDDKVIIEYTFIGTDASGEDISQGKATWKLGNRVIKTENIYTGDNLVDLTEYIGIGSDQKITLTISDDIGTIQQKTWYVSVVDVKLESTFDDTRTYEAGSTVTFTYTPKGAVDKTVHFLMDGKEIATKESLKASAGLSDSYVIPAQEHGSHLFEIYMTASINNNEIESNHIVKDIIWYDENSTVPVIGCVQQKFIAKQYETTNIVYTVFDPTTETPTVEIAVDGIVVSTPTLTTNTDTYLYKTDAIGEHIITIKCGETVKTIVATIEDLGIEVSPTIAGLEFDFNPVGYSNNDVNRIWADDNTGVTMSVSDNFDWVNGGYQIDDAGDQYFCVKAGTTATINYNLFADDAKENGKEFKVIFKTTNVKKRETSFISCMDYGIGLDMKVESANIYSSNGNLYSPYCEDDVIEFEFNINKNTDIPMVMTYEDGVGNRPMIYTSDSSFWQTNPTPIVIGSDNCDVWIYRMKAYSTSLSDRDILNNFIADARSAEEMVNRYKRNQIYKEGVLDPEYLAEVCPDLRIILIDAPWFTNDKDNKIDDTNITMIYKNGDPVLDNWTCTGARHRGQGTSSNEYGYAARNIDLVMNTDTSLFTLGDGVTTASTITLTRDSVPINYLNCKVNVASSEMENNAENARDYSLFNPFIRFARWKDSKVKDCMEFFNGVIFIRERNEDISTHREFQDTEYHFYSLCNVGDSKKSDSSRMNDKNDPKEHTLEITDYNVPLAEFPTGTDGVCPESEWKEGNAAYDFLYADYEYEDGEFKSFGDGSYEFRYEKKGITDEERQANIDTWRDMYKFIVTSSDEDFYAKLKEWFVVDSALYYYLFTENRIMVDSRAKNSFWHYGKVYITTEEALALGEDANGYIVDNEQAIIRNGYRYDLSQGYDFDKVMSK